jgi:hypothetical protein
MDREKIEKWIEDYENPSGPDHWVDPWTWAKAMREVLIELDEAEDAIHRFLRGEQV